MKDLTRDDPLGLYELKDTLPTPAMIGPTDTIELLSLRILNVHLHPFIAKWREKVLDSQTSKHKESESSDGASCQSELSQLRQAILVDAQHLGELIGVRDAAQLLRLDKASMSSLL